MQLSLKIKTLHESGLKMSKGFCARLVSGHNDHPQPEGSSHENSSANRTPSGEHGNGSQQVVDGVELQTTNKSALATVFNRLLCCCNNNE